ncbi:MAG: nuclear transport factor 2 family protein [Actinobacteria bacterium]|nr:nuclear transport factor 2 family protein [Actinomycetota bacterium]
MDKAGLEQLATDLFGAYGAGEMERMRSLMADEMVGWITNAEGGVDRTDGADAYMARLPDLSEAKLRTRVTQVLGLDEERVMTMIAIRASRKGKDLENYAAFLARVADGKVAELWMVEAQPAYSDEFWS